MIQPAREFLEYINRRILILESELEKLERARAKIPEIKTPEEEPRKEPGKQQNAA